MFKSLLQTIPTISGNFSLACKLNNYKKLTSIDYISYINDAILMPLDNKYNLSKDIKINLINGKYEFDIQKYFKEISSDFYKDTYQKNTNIFETYPQDSIYNLPDNRDKNFEFGCKKISYNKYQYQFQFYAPIYINNFEDLPDKFIIEIYYGTSIIKKIQIPIKSNDVSNKLNIYLKRFLGKVNDNIPVIWKFNERKIIYQNAIDCKNGGLINFTSYNTIDNKIVNHTIINEIDNLICQGYQQNNIILSECIPLAFIFNIDDLLGSNDYYYYHFNQFNIMGYYIKDGNKCQFSNFSTNYHHNYYQVSDFDNTSNELKIKQYNLFDNNILYSLSEGTNYELYYQNTFKNNYCQWKLYESDSYIVNTNVVFSNGISSNKFPVFKNLISLNINALYDNYNVLVPLYNYLSSFSEREQLLYNSLINKNYTNWFSIWDDETSLQNDLYDVYNGYAFINGIKYYISDENIKHFNIFVNPQIKSYEKDDILGNIILTKKTINGITQYNYSEENNQYYRKLNKEELNSLNSSDLVYIPYNMDIKYIDYDGVKNKVKGEVRNRIDEIIPNLSNNAQFKFDEVFNKIFDTYFVKIDGYIKSNIQTEDLVKTVLSGEIQNIISDNIYYSPSSDSLKSNLNSDLKNAKINYQQLIDKHCTLFYKKSLLEINNINKYNNIIWNEIDGLYASLKNTSKKIAKNDELKSMQTKFLETLLFEKDSLSSNLLKDELLEDKLLENGLSEAALLKKLLEELKKLKDISENNIFESPEDVNKFFVVEFMHMIVYMLICNILSKSKYNDPSELNVYQYIFYYDDGKIINKDYYEKMYNSGNYDNLYTNINPSDENPDDEPSTEIYIKIDDVEIFKYFLIKDSGDQSKSPYENFKSNDNFSILNKKIDTNKLIYEYEFSKFPIENIPENINEALLYNIDISSLYNLVKNNLYYKIELYTLDKKENFSYYLEKINNTDNSQPLLICKNDNSKPLFKYDENAHLIKDENNMVGNIMYADFSTVKEMNFKLEKLLKNVDSVDEKYVYKDPYNYLLQLTKNEYNTDYKYELNVYKKLDTLLSFELGSIENHGAYIKINYPLYLSSNLFNLSNVDSNDNFVIKSVNDINIDETSIKYLFKVIYPYLKHDILLETISYINNMENSNIKILYPNTIKYNINKFSKQNLDNKKFTTIEKSDNIINTIYLNRYFGNINPYFINVDQTINNIRSKIYVISKQNTNGIYTDISSDHDNVNIENINLYKYNPIYYYENHKTNNKLNSISQLEYKHFNNNYLLNLPIIIEFKPSNVKNIGKDQLSIYANKEKCFEYFKEYLQNNYFNFQTSKNQKLFLYIFNKYHIEYVQNTMINSYHQKIYQLTYKLTLL